MQQTSKLNTLLHVIDKLFEALVIVVMLAIIGVIVLQVFSRFALPSSPVWTEELSRYLFIYLIVLASGLVIRREAHVRLELFKDKLSIKQQACYEGFCHLVIAIFAIMIIPYAWKYAQIGTFQTSPTLYIPMIYIFISTVMFFSLTAFYSLVALLQNCFTFIKGSN